MMMCNEISGLFPQMHLSWDGQLAAPVLDLPLHCTAAIAGPLTRGGNWGNLPWTQVPKLHYPHITVVIGPHILDFPWAP